MTAFGWLGFFFFFFTGLRHPLVLPAHALPFWPDGQRWNCGGRLLIKRNISNRADSGGFWLGAERQQSQVADTVIIFWLDNRDFDVNVWGAHAPLPQKKKKERKAWRCCQECHRATSQTYQGAYSLDVLYKMMDRIQPARSRCHVLTLRWLTWLPWPMQGVAQCGGLDVFGIVSSV